MRSSARRSSTVSLLGFLAIGILPAVSAASSPVHIAATPAAGGVWQTRLNAWRANVGLPALVENATWSLGDYYHSRYMVETGQATHGESTTCSGCAAWYTPEGATASVNGNIQVSSSTATTDDQSIDWWMAAPFHAMGMMDPKLATTGFGSYRSNTSASPWHAGFSLDTQRGANAAGQWPVFFPGNGTTEPLTTYAGGEWPNPLQACPGYNVPTGLPVFVQVGSNMATSAVGPSSFTGNGGALPYCVIDSNKAAATISGANLTWRGGVIVIPQNPLQSGVQYVVSLTVNGAPYSWTFNVGALTSTPGQPLAVTAVAGDATATITWNPPTFGGNITSYTVTPYIGTTAQTPQVVMSPSTTATFNGLSNGATYVFTVAATNSVGTGAPASSFSVTPVANVIPPARMTAPSVLQRSLVNSDGVTWQDMDAANLSLSVTPTANTTAIVSANADLWTATPGVNQDIGIWMNPSSALGGIVAWKESGGSGGTFSPNAAAVQTVVALTANTTYSFKVRWKTNRPAIGATIFAGAGPLPGGGGISPSRLSVQLVPSSNIATASSTQQYSLANSDGATWQTIDGTNLATRLPSASTSSTAVLSANVDLWTANAGYNQDIAIFVSVNSGVDQLVAWKESGGSAGTYSPNAAFVQAVYAVNPATTYDFKLKWKAHHSAPGATIFAAAGPWPAGGAFSPTRLTAVLTPNANVAASSSAKQYSVANSDGTNWAEIDTALRVPVTPSSSGPMNLGASADLWTANAGFNQDIGIFVSLNGGADQLVAWKESGGSAGTFSPNAALVQSVYNVSAGTSYVFKLKWKTNKSAGGATIYAGAGPIGLLYSPTSLIVSS